MTRRLRDQVAVRLDGFIAGPDSGADRDHAWPRGVRLSPARVPRRAARASTSSTTIREKWWRPRRHVEVAVMPVLLGSGVALVTARRDSGT